MPDQLINEITDFKSNDENAFVNISKKSGYQIKIIFLLDNNHLSDVKVELT